jgi:hypothetical protein
LPAALHLTTIESKKENAMRVLTLEEMLLVAGGGKNCGGSGKGKGSSKGSGKGKGSCHGKGHSGSGKGKGKGKGC